MTEPRDALTTPFELSLVTATTGHVTKRLIAKADGTPTRDPNHTLGVSAGRVEHVQLAGLAALADLLPTLSKHHALIHGTPIDTVPGGDALTLLRKADYTGRPGTITRSLDHFAWPAGPHLLMGDYDPDPAHPDGVESAPQLMALLTALDPAFAACGWLATTSTSSAMKSQKTGDWLTPPRGMHVYVLVVGDVPRLQTWLTVKLWCAGHGYVKLSQPTATTGITGRLARTLLDLAVLSPERLDYVAGALIDKGVPFFQDLPPPELHAGGVLDLDALPPLSADEAQRARTLLQEARARLEPDRRQAVRARLDPALPAERIEEEVTTRLAQAERCELDGGHVLYFDNGTTITAEALRTRAGRALDGLHLRDPLFADDPGAAIFHWNTGEWRINSWYTGDMVTFRYAAGAQDDTRRHDAKAQHVAAFREEWGDQVPPEVVDLLETLVHTPEAKRVYASMAVLTTLEDVVFQSFKKVVQGLLGTSINLATLTKTWQKARRSHAPSRVAPPDPGDVGAETEQPRAKSADYVAFPSGLCRFGSADPVTGERATLRLTHFDCEITAEITRDDGSGALRRAVALRATAAGRARVCEIPSDEFDAMRWVTKNLGVRLVVRAGASTRDHVRAAIQELSPAMEERYIYEHTGWITLADVGLVYLHAGGAQSASGLREDITVDLPGLLSRYCLPPPPTDATRRAAIRHSLSLRHLLDDGAMVPLLGGTYLAPLRPFLPHDPPVFVLWLYGPTGSFKSETAALCLNHYGPEFSGTTLPGSFTATANALERMAFATKDALLVVDDFHPATNRKESESMAATVSRLLRGVGNGTGRARMNSDTTARPDLPPRGVVLATGERLPDGHSTSARMFLVTLAPARDATAMAARLTEAQHHREDYALAMSGYLAWLAGQDAAFAPTLRERFHTLRTKAQTAGAHARQPGAVAHLMLGWEVFTTYAHEAGALTRDERDTVLLQVWAQLTTAAAAHAASLQTLRPDQRALDLLRDGFAGKRAYLETLHGEEPSDGADWGWARESERDGLGLHQPVLRRPPGGVLLGYVADEWLYLLPEATYQFLSKASRDAGQVFPVELKTLLKHLDEAGMIGVQGSGTERRRVVRQRVAGAILRVVKLSRAVVPGTTGNSTDTGNSTTAVVSTSYEAVPGVPGNCAPGGIYSATGGIYREEESEEKEEEKNARQAASQYRGEEAALYPRYLFTGNNGNSGNRALKKRVDTEGNDVPGKLSTVFTPGTPGTAQTPRTDDAVTDAPCPAGGPHTVLPTSRGVLCARGNARVPAAAHPDDPTEPPFLACAVAQEGPTVTEKPPQTPTGSTPRDAGAPVLFPDATDPHATICPGGGAHRWVQTRPDALEWGCARCGAPMPYA